jgi:ligand-binding SRPBCC domain-containing protein
MKLTLRTHVRQPMAQIWAGFDRALFDKLSPPFPPVEVVRFDGCLTGDVVILRLNFLFFKQDWTSLIRDQQTLSNEIFFIDEGTQLPFFLTYWHHRHRLIANPETGGTIVADEITFRTPSRLTDLLFWPLLWVQFAYRKPIYRRIFS